MVLSKLNGMDKSMRGARDKFLGRIKGLWKISTSTDGLNI